MIKSKAKGISGELRMVDLNSRGSSPGLVCTFYSYKGGVGRSMALANVGVLMAHEGRRVLMVDWDLEAPGLEHYFEKAAKLVGNPTEKNGVVDLLHAHSKGEPISWRDCLLRAEFFGHSVDILSAGRQDESYRQRVQALDWEALFSEHKIGNYINSLRDEWRSVYDFVLIDSRTGITDIGDICTVILPDVLVFLFVTNHQSVDGTKDVMDRAVKSRSRMPVNRSKLLGVPVPARDERDKEYDKSIEWQRIFASEFGELYREWLPKEVSPSDALNRIFIPYVASWSFGEHLPVIESERERSDPTSLGAAYGRLATLLSHRLDWSVLEARSSEADVAGARVEISKAREAAREAELRRIEDERQRQMEVEIAEKDKVELKRLLVEAHARRRKLLFAFLSLIIIALVAALFAWQAYLAKRSQEGMIEQKLRLEAAEMRMKDAEMEARMSRAAQMQQLIELERATRKQEAVSALSASGFVWNSQSAQIEVTTEGAKKLVNIGPIIGMFQDISPESLVLKGCVNLRNLDGIEKLTSLKVLNLSGCAALEDVEILSSLGRLEKLDLSGCTSLKADGLVKLKSALPKAVITFPDDKTTNP